MNEGLIPKRYAKALYKFACEKGADLGLYRLMGNLGRSFADNPALDSTVANPFVSDDQKIGLLKTAAAAVAAPAAKDGADAKAGDVYADFLKLLGNNKRLPMAGAIARAYCDIYRKENRIYRVTVVSAKPLDAPEQQRLLKLIESHLDGGKMEYSFSTDPELIGGFTVDIDNERLDASVKNELKQLRLKLLKQA
ncbi:MAG: ATP synthase F1 subunit delta [Muribaculaceae bacterium]|nr:ATP synthase F1 subunit delta [Muribaculaceae bacterium]